MRAAIAACVLLAACAPLQRPDPLPPEIRTTTIEVKIPVIVPCFTEAERPALPVPTFTTEAQIIAASPEQLAAADRADRLALEVYSSSVDALFVACLAKPTTKGPKP